MTSGVRPAQIDGRASSRGGIAFLPSMLPGLALWLDSAMGITLNGSTVSAWADQSGNGHNFTQAVGGNQPAYNATDASFAGAPSLGFTGSQWLDSGTLSIVQPDTWIVVCKSTVGGASIIDTAAGGTGRQLTGTQSSTNHYNIYAGGSVIAATTTIASASVCASVFNNPSSSLGYVNNSQASVCSGSAGANGMTKVEIGAYSGGSLAQLTGSIVCILNYNSALSPSQLQQVFAYLGHRYGISVS